MSRRVSSVSTSVGLLLCSFSSLLVADDDIEHFEITGSRIHNQTIAETQQQSPQPDVAALLSALPGANVNRNGPVSGIAQYRGLYGDRVNVRVGGRPAIGAGPNAMDAPLSYAAGIITRDLLLHRGIASVSSGVDTFGGSIEAELFTPEFSDNSQTQVSATLIGGYRDNGEASDLGGRINIANPSHALQLYAEERRGRDDSEAGDGRAMAPSEYRKQVAGVGYRYRLPQGAVGGDYQYLDTQDAGTPALPMDIDYIRTHSGSLVANWDWGHWQWQASFGAINADHVMDNYRLRSNPEPDKHRKNTTTNDSFDWRLQARSELSSGELLLGLDGYVSEHDAVITNPNNAMFRVVNFNQVKDNRMGIFAQWQTQEHNWEWQVGARLKYIHADADKVDHFMAMMNPNLRELVERFNQADRSQHDTLVDVTGHLRYQFAAALQGELGIAVKQRAASYQQRYLWLPMQATGGLADGNTYIGDIQLDAETAWQFELALDWQTQNWQLAPRLFYQRIDDYIQGRPVDDPTVLMVANMMGSGAPLQFANLDAELYGADLFWQWALNDRFLLGGQASYVRGKRRDIHDNLYRIAPPNVGVYMQFQAERWWLRADWRGYVEQDKVAQTNREQKTPGYGTLALSANYQLTPDWLVRAGIDNVFDKDYQDHLAGYNRAKGTEFDLGERLHGVGRALWLNTQYLF